MHGGVFLSLHFPDPNPSLPADRTASRATFSSAAWTPCWSRRRRGWRPPTSWEICTLMLVSKGVLSITAQWLKSWAFMAGSPLDQLILPRFAPHFNHLPRGKFKMSGHSSPILALAFMNACHVSILIKEQTPWNIVLFIPQPDSFRINIYNFATMHTLIPAFINSNIEQVSPLKCTL